MSRRQAIDLAMDARTRKGASSLLSVGPLPDGVKDLLRIVAEGEWRDAATEHVYRLHGADEVRSASAAFLIAALFNRKSDPYRILGLAPRATPEDVRENKRLLLKWLHPDRNPSPRERAYFARVIEAAKTIEEGRARPGSGADARPPKIVVPPRSKPSRRPKADPARQAALRLFDGVTHFGKFLLLTAVITFIGLLSWRYFMDEPIGTSIERYSKMAQGMMKW